MLETFRLNLFEKVNASGLSAFRIAYTFVLMCELFRINRFRHIIFDKVPFSNPAEIDISHVLFFWFIVLFFLLIGYKTRFSSILNYVFSVIVFGSSVNFEYHVFPAYIAINFLIMFMPVSRTISVDSVVNAVRYSDTGGFFKPDKQVLAINYFIVPFFALGIVYFDSILFKFNSKVWMDGLGMWLPASLPMFIWTNTSYILDMEFLVKFMGYLVLIFELLFVFLFWNRRLKLPFMLLGVFFHVGILTVFPIPQFGLAAVSVYILLIPLKFWDRMEKWLETKRVKYRLYYDAECPLCIKTIAVIRTLDVMNRVECLSVQKHASAEAAFGNIGYDDLLVNMHGVDKKGKVYIGYYAYIGLYKTFFIGFPIGKLFELSPFSGVGRWIYRKIAGNRLKQRCTADLCQMPVIQQPFPETQNYLITGFNQLAITKKFWIALLIIFTTLQTLLSLQSPLSQKILNGTALNKPLQILFEGLKRPLKSFFGLCQHPVFMDSHYEGYDHIVKVTYLCQNGREIPLPLLNSQGMTDRYLVGPMWGNYTFKVSSPAFRSDQFEKGIVPYLDFFSRHYPEALPEGHFVFYEKRIDIPTAWRKGHLEAQLKRSWNHLGTYNQSGHNAGFHWNEAILKAMQ